MTTRLNPYLTFRGEAAQALAFYAGALGGSPHVMTFGEFGVSDEPLAGQVMHGMLATPSGFTLMCADVPPGMELTPGTNVSVSLSGDDADELRGYWERLSDGATITTPLEQQMWGDIFGQLTDRFGVVWLVDIADGAPTPQAQR